MLPLKALPKILKHASAGKDNRQQGALAAIKLNDSERASSSSAVSAMEAEEKTLREQVMVLEEQRFLMEAQLADASKRRKFDEALSLKQNVKDLNREIDRVQGQISNLDFAGAYGAIV